MRDAAALLRLYRVVDQMHRPRNIGPARGKPGTLSLPNCNKNRAIESSVGNMDPKPDSAGVLK
jgi:hypothetical protein